MGWWLSAGAPAFYQSMSRKRCERAGNVSHNGSVAGAKGSPESAVFSGSTTEERQRSRMED